jgi:hypothetical protein
MSTIANQNSAQSRSRLDDAEFEITFSLAAGYSEEDAIELYEYIERHRAVDGAALSGRFGERVERYEPDA